ncbi:ABC-type transport system involved in multi-copper enzyme maturation permease subunit [Pseudoxanthomonas japonensis]|uniref:hypothetical protein n=1 Tax=Pseudoxanthomonas japonensis TaxID=69284 RepID=UPI0028581411|nr:hypothetical protein [Pseudoxanthomonas japonensis]MDR7068782.1 ABC-type transport system involved in multi-copper enzyme maturation permease subunit [Pseudoxanthomonas japonensis]
MTPMLMVMNFLNCLILIAVLALLASNWRAHTMAVSRSVIGLIVLAMLVCACMMFIAGALPYLEGWGAVFVVLGFLNGFLERRYRRRTRGDGP